MPNNGYSAPCVTSQPGPWDDDDSLYEMAEQAWNECWPPEPPKQVSKFTQLAYDRGWLMDVFARIVREYDGPLSDIGYHLGEFGDKWIEMKAEALLEDAREAEAEARAESTPPTSWNLYADGREGW